MSRFGNLARLQGQPGMLKISGMRNGSIALCCSESGTIPNSGPYVPACNHSHSIVIKRKISFHINMLLMTIRLMP